MFSEKGEGRGIGCVSMELPNSALGMGIPLRRIRDVIGVAR